MFGSGPPTISSAASAAANQGSPSQQEKQLPWKQPRAAMPFEPGALMGARLGHAAPGREEAALRRLRGGENPPGLSNRARPSG